ncbi:unnamed protein product, partial [Hapterophycus canaliculatus]
DRYHKVAWKRFWMQKQRYETICLQCITKNKEHAREGNLYGVMEESDEEEEPSSYPDWGPVYLSAASKAILIKWYRRAQETVWGKAGRRRPPVSVEISDDEGEDVPKDWVISQVVLSDASRALAIRWLRTARARLQRRGN